MNKQSFITILLTVLMIMTGAKTFAHVVEALNDDGVTIYYSWANNKTELAVTYRGFFENEYSNEYTGNVVIPASVYYDGKTFPVTSIGASAFYGCSGLTSINIPNSVTSIGYSAFSGCSGLTSVSIPGSVESIGWGAFEATAWYNNQSDGLVYAGKIAYKYKGEMPANTNIIIKDGTLGITSSAFYNCSGLTSVTIPNSVTSIGSSAFKNCSGLFSVSIPEGVTSIGGSAFYGCSSLTSIIIPNSVESIGDGAFSGCSSLTSITIPNSVTSIDGGAFEATAWYNNQPDGLVYAGKIAYNYKGEMPANTNIIIKDGTLGIASSAFAYCSGLTSVTIPNSVTSIGKSAFYNCSGLTSVSIPGSVESIGWGAFNGCSGLTSVTIPSSVTSIDGWAFNGCSGLTSVKVTVTDFSAFCNNKIINSIRNQIEKPIHLIDSEGTEITEYIVPNDVTAIGDGVFSGCSGLISITIPNSLESIGEGAFSGCSGLTSVSIPESVTSIGHSAFENCSSLISVTIPNSVTSISSSAFWGCSGLTSVTIPNSVTSIGSYAFKNCSSLTSIIIPNSVESIGEGAFSGCSGLTSITIPNSVTSIGEYAFNNCSGLTSVSIPNSVTSIGYSAFSGCASILLVRSFITEPYSIDKSVFPNEVYRQSTLYIPAGTEKLYTRFDGWREFLKIEEMDGSEEEEIPGAEKCAIPTISYENNKLSFSSQTEGVDYKYKIESNDVKEGFGNDIQMTRTYKVTVIAFKDGMNNSDPAIIIIGKKGDVNGDDKVDVADHVELSKIIMEQGQ